MRKLLCLFVIVLAFSSCEKEDFGQYKETVEEQAILDSTIYANGGTIPSVGAGTNDLVGTQWILTKYVAAFVTEYPNDTIDFITVNTYTVNGGAEKTYALSGIPASTNHELSFYSFTSFGGSNYSANVGQTFVEDGEINNAEFHNIQNTTSKIRAFFIKN